jgi:predicted hotdog family 3-hydroxylacyl-ACP dehydratase
MENRPVACPVDKPLLFRYSPHRGSMLLLDRLEDYSFSPAALTALVDITSTSPFFDHEIKMVPPWVSFEYMAQSIALLAGLRGASRGEKPNIGFIMGVREFKAFCDGFPEGKKVEIHIRQVLLHEAVAVFKGEAWMDGVRAAAGTLSTVEGSPALIARMKENASE